MIGIYKIINLINGHSYVGQSRHVEERWREHINCSRNVNSQSYNYPLQKAFRKYGVENFSFILLEECNVENLSVREKYWMTQNDCSYNQTLNSTVNVVSCKLSKEQVYNIQQELLNDTNNEIYYSYLAAKYHVSEQTISDINVGRSWCNSSLTYPLRKVSHKGKAQIYYCQDCGIPISKGALRCSKCRGRASSKVNRPSREELKQLIRTTPFTQIGKKFGVSDNAIRKWCDSYSLPRKVTEIKKISDIDWKSL